MQRREEVRCFSWIYIGERREVRARENLYTTAVCRSAFFGWMREGLGALEGWDFIKISDLVFT